MTHAEAVVYADNAVLLAGHPDDVLTARERRHWGRTVKYAHKLITQTRVGTCAVVGVSATPVGELPDEVRGIMEKNGREALVATLTEGP